MADKGTQDDVRIDLPWVWILGSGLAILLIWIAGGWVPFWVYGSDPKESGPFGDTFGAVNSLFTGLAFFGVIVTILLQMRDLALQREVLKDTRAELQGQKEAQERQAGILEQTAKLNALIALTNHAAKAYEHAMTTDQPTVNRQARAKEYDAYVDRLHSFVQDLAAKDAQGFAFLAMEQDRSQWPRLEVNVESVEPATSSGAPENRKTSFSFRLRLINRTKSLMTIREATGYMKTKDGKLLTVPIRDAVERVLTGEGGTRTIRGETEEMLINSADVPKLGFVVIKTFQQDEPFEFPLDPEIASEVTGRRV